MNSSFFGLLTTSRKTTTSAGGGGLPTPDILWWPLNDPPGTTITASVGPGSTTNTGTLNNDYLSLATVDNYFETSSNVTYGTNIVTLSFWLRLNAWTSGGWFRFPSGVTTNAFSLYQFGGTSQVYLVGSTGIRQENFADSIDALNTWYHIVLVYDNSTANGDIKMFVDNTAQTPTLEENTKTGTSNFSTALLQIKFPTAPDSVFDLDDFRIYGRELSGTEISDIYAAGRP